MFNPFKITDFISNFQFSMFLVFIFLFIIVISIFAGFVMGIFFDNTEMGEMLYDYLQQSQMSVEEICENY